MQKLIVVLFGTVLMLSKMAGFGILGFLVYYVYNHGIEQFLTALWKGF